VPEFLRNRLPPPPSTNDELINGTSFGHPYSEKSLTSFFFAKKHSPYEEYGL